MTLAVTSAAIVSVPAAAPAIAAVGPVCPSYAPPSVNPCPGPYAKPGSPTVSGSLSGLASRKASLRLKFTAGKGAPGLVRFSVRLPRGLAFIKKTLNKGISAPGASKVTLTGGVLIVTYQPARSGMTISIGSKALSVSKRLAKQAKQKKIKSLQFAFTTTDASGHISRLRLTIKKPR